MSDGTASTQPSTSTGTNGHQGMSNVEMQEFIANQGTHLEFVDELITQLHNDPYAPFLHIPAYQRRLARIKLEQPTLYESKLVKAAAIFLGPGRAAEWERKIDTLSLAHAELDIVPLSAIAPEEITWLWYPYIPLKKLTMVEGDPSSGKTYLLLSIAAAITKGYALPDQEGRVEKPSPDRGGNVLYITAEDGLGDTIRPRAEKVGADLDRLFVPREPQSFSLAEPQVLQNAMTRFHPQLVILDPLQAFLGAEVDMHRANEVRPLMTTLLALAIQHECAIIMVRHWTKAVGGRARHRGQGNVDFAAAARSQLSVGESPNDAGMRIMAQAKMSLAALGSSIVFQITDEGLFWCGTSTITADELSQAQPNVHHNQRKDAMKWLKDYLKDGPQPSDMVIHAAEAVGISERTLKRAKEHLGVLSAQENRIWFWRLSTIQKWERERDRYPGQEDDEPPF